MEPRLTYFVLHPDLNRQSIRRIQHNERHNNLVNTSSGVSTLLDTAITNSPAHLPSRPLSGLVAGLDYIHFAADYEVEPEQIPIATSSTTNDTPGLNSNRGGDIEWGSGSLFYELLNSNYYY